MSQKKTATSPKKQFFNVVFKVDNIEVVKSDISIPQNFNPEERDGLKYRLEADVDTNIEKSSITIQVRYEFSKSDDKIFVFYVATRFLLRNEIKRAAASDVFLQQLIQISIDHARGIQSIVLKDTSLSKLYIPAVQGRGFSRKEEE